MLNIPVVAYHGDEDHWVLKDEVASWRLTTNSSFDLRGYPGGHLANYALGAAIMRELAGDSLVGVGERDEP